MASNFICDLKIHNGKRRGMRKQIYLKFSFYKFRQFCDTSYPQRALNKLVTKI